MRRLLLAGALISLPFAMSGIAFLKAEKSAVTEATDDDGAKGTGDPTAKEEPSDTEADDKADPKAAPAVTPPTSDKVEKPEIPAGSRQVPFDTGMFRPDPKVQPGSTYDAEGQLKIYGDKRVNPTQRPLLELGRELYAQGPFQEASDFFGKKNLLFPHFLLYGDWRTAAAYNDNGALEQGTLATRLNLDVDIKLTATERIHAFFRPLDENGQFTRVDFSGANHNSFLRLDPTPDALFFEGDLGRIAAGLSDKENTLDMPFAVGLMPLLFQNGIWVEDAFTGVAATIPARNSPLLDISNADITFFAGFDEVTSGAIKDRNGKLVEDNAHIYGVTSFIEAGQGYWELGYGYTDATGELSDLDYHNMTAAFTRRYGGFLSNTMRAVWNFGQHRDSLQPETADGVIFLIENSWITSQPSTLVPYFNAFVGLDRPQSLARDAGAGGILKNTGILFETDGLTGFPKMDDTGQDTYGAALGVEYLFDLDQQIVLEASALDVIGDANEPGRPSRSNQIGTGIRYQVPISNAWILRADVMSAWRAQDEDLFGIRLEIRSKF